MAADAGSTPVGRLFITVRASNLRFLVDTGSELCVFHRKLVSGSKERASYDLFLANGTPIPPYGWRTLTLNLGIRRDFNWRFVGADVQIPIIGVDFLANFNLLFDCRNNRIKDGITSLSAPAQKASTRFPSVKTIRSTTPVDMHFTEFPPHTAFGNSAGRTPQNSTPHQNDTGPTGILSTSSACS
jgi:hypothetical protein